MTPKVERCQTRRRFIVGLLCCAAVVAFVVLVDGISVQDFLIYGVSICLVATILALVIIVGCALRMESNIPQGALFESSDGIWTDSTFEIKCQGFDAVLFSFEAYKLKHGKSDVSLVRASPEPRWWFIHSKRKRSDPKWKVPFQTPSGHAMKMTLNLNEQECEDVRRRADAALAYWQTL